MKGDFSKETFRADKHFHDVLMQQGRVLLDTDWNEQARLNAYRTETGTKDIIGLTGAPFDNAGFKIEPLSESPPTTDLKILAGHFYVDGILCENENDTSFETQPNLPLQALPTTAGNYLFYLDVWLQHITAIEDGSLREVALGGTDTTTRTKAVWQVKYANSTAKNCIQATLPAETDASTITLSARSELTADTTNPCEFTATGGYRRLQNQLYRVEIHRGSNPPDGPTFKWSRENGSIVVKWEGQDNVDPAQLKVSSLGKDELLGFHTGDWIELIDDNTDLLNKPGILAKLSKPPQNNILFIDSIIDPDNPSATSVCIKNRTNPRIRKWDSPGELKLDFDTWIELEDGVQINAGTGTSKTGDYWTIPGRTPLADVEWLRDESNIPLFLPPFGIKHHFAKLAILNLDAYDNWTCISDCRNLFPALTELTSLYYIGGGGQEAMPGNPLPGPLMVGVANGQIPVKNARVKFEIVSGGGVLTTRAGGIVTTDSDGFASCNWTPGTDITNLALQVKASLIDDGGNCLPQLPVLFNASFSIASNINYESKCVNWAGVAPTTVAEALDQLCERQNVDTCCSILIGTAGKYKTLGEAVSDLSKQRNPAEDLDVSLCFLPGNHVIDEDIDMSQMNFQTLHITGTAAYITMNAKSIGLVADKKIVLEGFSLDTPSDRNQVIDPQIIIITTNQLTVDHCSFTRNGADVNGDGIPGDADAPFICINNTKSTVVYLLNSTFLGFFSLILANGIQGVIENNTIAYLLLQWGGILSPFSPNPIGWDPLNKKDLIASLRDPATQKSIVNLTGLALSIHANRFGLVNTDFARPLPRDVYQSLFISENIFQSNFNVFVSQIMNLTNNQFIQPVDVQSNPIIPHAYVLGWDVVIIGNRGPATFGPIIEVAAPVRLPGIDATVVNSIAGQSSGESGVPVSLVNVLNLLIVKLD